MSHRDFKATILKLHSDHEISCPTTTENALVDSLQALQLQGKLTKDEVQNLAARMSPQFFKQNGFDSPSQYARLLWDGISVARSEPAVTKSETHFHGPVTQTGIIQTGAGSTAQWVGNNQTLRFRQEFVSAIARAKEAAAVELDETHRDQAEAIIEAVEIEAAQPEADTGKIKRLLKPMLKWTGERFTNAIDAAVGAIVASTLKPGG